MNDSQFAFSLILSLFAYLCAGFFALEASGGMSYSTSIICYVLFPFHYFVFVRIGGCTRPERSRRRVPRYAIPKPKVTKEVQYIHVYESPAQFLRRQYQKKIDDLKASGMSDEDLKEVAEDLNDELLRDLHRFL